MHHFYEARNQHSQTRNWSSIMIADFANSRWIEKALPRFLRRHCDCVVDERGASAVEFAIVAPLMIGIMLASFQFALTINGYVGVANAVSVGTRSFSMTRASAVTTPYTSTVATMKSALPTTMTQSNLVVTLSVGDATGTTYTACATDSACAALLTTTGLPVKVKAAYPKSFSLKVLEPYYSYAYTFNLTSTTIGRLE